MVWFYTWDASGNMIDGSAEKTERFRLMRSATIQPVRRPTTTAWMTGVAGEQGYTVEWSGVGPYGHMVASGSGTALLEVPLGAYVKMRAYRYKEPPGGSGTSTAGADKTYARKWEYKFAANDYFYNTFSSSPAFNFSVAHNIAPLFGPPPTHGTITLSVSSPDGGDAFIDGKATLMPWDSTDGCLFESVTVERPDPEDTGSRTVRAACKPHPGNEVAGWTGDFTMYPGIRTLAGLSYTKDTSASGGGPQLIDMQKLEVEVEVDGGDGTPAEAGRIIAYPARKYYSIFNTTLVELDVSTNTCFAFQRWSGDGVAYPANVLTGQPNLGNPLALDDPDNPVTDSTIWVMMGLGVDRTVTAHVQVPEVQITYAEITEDRIDVILQPETYTGTFQLRLTGPGGVSHTIRTEARTGGQHQETFDIPNLPIAEFTNVEAWWGCEETLQTFAHHFQNLGVYRHSQYNTPRESDSTCAGEPIEVRFYSVPGCTFETGTLSSRFVAEVNENGSGVSISHGLIQREWFCGSGNLRFRTGGVITPSCGGQGVGATTVARSPDNGDLGCGDQVLIVGLGTGVGTVKTVTDEGEGVGLTQLDNYTDNGACSGIGDLGNFVTIKLF